MSDDGQVSLRRDARRNRAALVAAAEIEFALEGPDVPLDAVVRRAGVGRGTLYRHFAGRVDLAVAIYERHIAEHEAFVAAHADEPDVVFRLLDRMAETQARTRGVAMVLARETDGEARIQHLVTRITALFDVTLAGGRDAGLVSPDVSSADLLLVLSMLEGALVGVPLDEAPRVAHRVVELVTPAVRAVPAPA